MSHHFRVGDLSQNEWVKLNTNYPCIKIIVDKLYEYSGVLDHFNVNLAINIYNKLLYDGISPKNAMKHWNMHLSLMNRNLQNKKNDDHYRYFQIYMENINYHIKKDLDLSRI
jgi:hypothetical protein